VRTKYWEGATLEPAEVGGAPGLLVREGGVTRVVIAIAGDGTAIESLNVIVAPEKVARIVRSSR
jgi:hypothetical protein